MDKKKKEGKEETVLMSLRMIEMVVCFFNVIQKTKQKMFEFFIKD